MLIEDAYANVAKLVSCCYHWHICTFVTSVMFAFYIMCTSSRKTWIVLIIS